MKTKLQNYLIRTAFALACFLAVQNSAFAQTPGLIFNPATSGGKQVLDPNGDGYVSVPSVPPGWVPGARDEGVGFSEIPYRPFPALTTEPIGDLTTGAAGGHTDLAPPSYPSATGSPIAAYYNGTHVMFRVRLGGASTASKGYSVLIDSNGEFASPTAPQPSNITNPGFEFEVLLASNFEVSIFDHRTSPSKKIFVGSVDQFSQKAVAATTASSNPDYFYDFYVPLSGFGGAINANTALRFSGITITSAQSGLTGTVSDMGGVNYAAYGHDPWKAWTSVISSFPASSLNQIQAGGFTQIAVAPVVTGPITAGVTSISGTSTEAAGSIITVYRTAANGTRTQIGTATVSATGTWTLTGIPSSLLVSGDVITATVTAPNKPVSAFSTGVNVISGLCTATPVPVLTSISNAGGQGSLRLFNGTTTLNGLQRIKIYPATATPGVTQPTATVDINAGTTASTTPYTWVTTTGVSLADNNYFATTQPITAIGGTVTGCESLRSNQICVRQNSSSANLQIPSITSVQYDGQSYSSTTSSTWFETPVNLTQIAGSVNLNNTTLSGVARIFKNGTLVEGIAGAGFNTTAPSSFIFNLTDADRAALNLMAGDIISVRTVVTLTTTGGASCPESFSRPSNFLNVQATSVAPTINPLGCGLVTSLSGTSVEPAGTVLQFYTGGTAGQRNGTLVVQSGTTTPVTATVTSQGTWGVSLSSVAGGGIAAGTAITARAKAPGEVRSVNSNVVSSSVATALPAGASFSISPVSEAANVEELISIRGMGPASVSGGPTYNVSIEIDGTPFPAVATNSSGQWELNGISPREVYAGAVVRATFTSSANTCPSAPITTTVLCNPPYTTQTVSPTSLTICTGSTASVVVGNSLAGVAYRLVVRTGAGTSADPYVYTETGSSVLGTGGVITLTSGTLSSNVTLAVRARRVTGISCTAILPGTVAITVRPLPSPTLAFTISSSSGCAGVSPVFTIPTQNGFAYQLINNATSEPVPITAINGTTVAATTNAVPGTGGTITVTPAPIYATTTFSVRIYNTQQQPSCSIISTNTQTYTVNSGPDPNQAVTLTLPRICSGSSTTITLASSVNGYVYELRRADNTVVQTVTSTGTGGVTFTVSPTTTTTYYVQVRTNTTPACTVNLLNQVRLEVISAASGFVVSAGENQMLCGTTSATLQGTNPAPGTGVWTTNTNATITSPNSPTTTVTGLTTGTYEFTWTVNTSCTGTTFAVTRVVINCPASYIVAPPRYANQYTGGDRLATASDPDGAISLAGVVSGNFPSTWAEVRSNGNIVVQAGQRPIAGTYTFIVRTTDVYGVSTDNQITLTIYGDEPLISPLPVELAYFTAVVENEKVILKWMTATEENNDRFVVERSTDGRVYTALGTVKGQGNSSVSIKYSFADKAPVTGTAYYRLKQVDFNGEFTYSNIIAVEASGVANNLQLQAYPNPFTDHVTVAVTSPSAEKAQLQLFDLQGRVIQTRTVDLSKGLTEMDLNVQNLSGGVYILKVTGNGIETKARILKTH